MYAARLVSWTLYYFCNLIEFALVEEKYGRENTEKMIRNLKADPEVLAHLRDVNDLSSGDEGNSGKAAENANSEDDSETEEEEDEVGEEITPDVDAQILKTILAIRNRVPEIYDSQINFFGGKCERSVECSNQSFMFVIRGQDEKSKDGGG